MSVFWIFVILSVLYEIQELMPTMEAHAWRKIIEHLQEEKRRNNGRR